MRVCDSDDRSTRLLDLTLDRRDGVRFTSPEQPYEILFMDNHAHPRTVEADAFANDQWEELRRTPEPLLKGYEDYVRYSGEIMEYNGEWVEVGTLDYPLYNEAIYRGYAAYANYFLWWKERELAEYQEAGKFGLVIALHAEFYRDKAFAEYCAPDKRLKDAEYWQLLGEILVEKRRWSPDKDILLPLLQEERPERENLMTIEEREALANLPAEMRVYSDYWPPSGDGIYWNLQEVGEAPEGQQLSRHVTTGTIRKAQVLAYISRTGEAGLVCDPADVAHDVVAARL